MGTATTPQIQCLWPAGVPPRRKPHVIEASGGEVIELLNITFARAVLAVALVHVGLVACASAATEVVSKSDLDIILSDAGVNMEGKGDCDCAASLYGSNTAVNGSHRGDGEDIPADIITRAAASATGEMTGAPATTINRTALKSVTVKDGGAFLQMNAGRLTTCVFGAPNASGCGN
jgi:hypothetical protein